MKKKKTDDALAKYKKELEVDPYSYAVMCKQASLLIQTGEVDQAISILQDTDRKVPSLGCAQYELGRAWLRKNQFERAARHLETAVALNPEYAPAYFLLGQAFARAGNTEKAGAAFEKSRLLREQHPKQVEENLNSLQPEDDSQPDE